AYARTSAAIFSGVPRIAYDDSAGPSNQTRTRAESAGIGRPAAVAAALMTSSRFAYAAGPVELEWYPSPRVPALRSAGSARPPMTIGNGAWTGRGPNTKSSIVWKRPSNGSVAPDQR